MGDEYFDSSLRRSHHVIDCPCLECRHEFLVECVINRCQCCDLEDIYFMLTGDEVRES